MATISIYNQEGKVVGDLSLNDKIFAVKPNQALVHEAVVAQRANARRSISNTKNRGEVRGGGKKPWKQKGTGRARQGSIRSPQWVGGGIVFGPRAERNFELKINRKAKQKALFMALSDKLINKQLLVIDSVKTEPVKTKIVAEMIKKLPVGRTILLVTPKADPALMRMVRNIPSVTLVSSNSVNLVDVLGHKSVAFLKDAVASFEKLYA
ncbi:MAG: 50S ribosomal protein L4 [Patescibacteria group bacterium]